MKLQPVYEKQMLQLELLFFTVKDILKALVYF